MQVQPIHSMSASLQQTPNGWSFLSEAALENFVWNNLTIVAGLYPAPATVCLQR